MMNCEEFKTLINDLSNKAISIACSRRGNDKKFVDGVEFNVDGAEVSFSEPEACGCCTDNYYETVSMEELFKEELPWYIGDAAASEEHIVDNIPTIKLPTGNNYNSGVVVMDRIY